MKNKKDYVYIRFFLIINLLFLIDSKYVIIPLTKYNYDFNTNENILSRRYSNTYYTKLLIGEPPQPIATFINTSSISNIGVINKFCDKKFYMNNTSINKDYIYKNSSTFDNNGNDNMILGTKDLIIYDQIKLFTNFELTNEITIDNISILYNPNNEGYIIDDVGLDFILEREKRTTCGYIGLQLGFQRSNIYNNLLEQLKQKKIITNTVFSFIETNKENDLYKKNNIDYLLIIGDELYDVVNDKNIEKYISNKYNKNKIQEKIKLNDYVINEGYYYFVWEITCSNIYLNMNNNDNYTNLEHIQDVYIDQDFGLILGSGEYRKIIEQTFFNDYISSLKCQKIMVKKNNLDNYFYYFACNEDINLEQFPTIIFKSKILQYEFSLGKDELFIKDRGMLYFLIVFGLKDTFSWKLGKPFLDKYLFSYNYEARTINFYNENLLENEVKDNNNNDNNLSDDKDYIKIIFIILIVILALSALILGFIYGKSIYNKRKKHKAYELETDSDNRLIKDDNEENKESKESLSINQ